MDNQDRLVDLVSEKGRRDLDVYIPRLEEGTALGLKAKRLGGLVVRAAARDAGFETGRCAPEGWLPLTRRGCGL